MHVTSRGGSGLSPKTQSPRVGLGSKPNFFTYIVKPEPNKSPCYLVNFSGPKKPEPKVWSPSPTRAPQKNRPDPILVTSYQCKTNGFRLSPASSRRLRRRRRRLRLSSFAGLGSPPSPRSCRPPSKSCSAAHETRRPKFWTRQRRPRRQSGCFCGRNFVIIHF
jgi:hypothetical protein